MKPTTSETIRYSPSMILRETFPVGAFQCNCTILACGDTKEALVVDPGGDFDRIREVIEHYDLTVKAVVHTHAHIDHIFCTRDVKEQFGGQVMLHREDLPLYKGFTAQAMMFGFQVRDTVPVDAYLNEGDTIAFGKRNALVMHTPGHTPGSVCFELEHDGDNVVFSGDTLFQRSIGRTDLPGGDSRLILESIRTKRYTRRPDSVGVPGRGPVSAPAGDPPHRKFFFPASIRFAMALVSN